jgi:hypothetical protein
MTTEKDNVVYARGKYLGSEPGWIAVFSSKEDEFSRQKYKLFFGTENEVRKEAMEYQNDTGRRNIVVVPEEKFKEWEKDWSEFQAMRTSKKLSGIVHNRISAKEEEAIIKLKGKGYTIKEIESFTQRSQPTISRYCKKRREELEKKKKNQT